MFAGMKLYHYHKLETWGRGGCIFPCILHPFAVYLKSCEYTLLTLSGVRDHNHWFCSCFSHNIERAPLLCSFWDTKRHVVYALWQCTLTITSEKLCIWQRYFLHRVTAIHIKSVPKTWCKSPWLPTHSLKIRKHKIYCFCTPPEGCRPLLPKKCSYFPAACCSLKCVSDFYPD